MNIIDSYTIETIGNVWKYGISGPATIYLKNGLLHRDGDLPAVEYKNGYKVWYKNGKLHRDGNLPAVDCSGKSKNGVRFTTIDYTDGYKAWYRDGIYHRDGGLPVIEYPDGQKVWYKDGKLNNDIYFPNLVKLDKSK